MVLEEILGEHLLGDGGKGVARQRLAHPLRLPLARLPAQEHGPQAERARRGRERELFDTRRLPVDLVQEGERSVGVIAEKISLERIGAIIAGRWPREHFPVRWRPDSNPRSDDMADKHAHTPPAAAGSRPHLLARIVPRGLPDDPVRRAHAGRRSLARFVSTSAINPPIARADEGEPVRRRSSRGLLRGAMGSIRSAYEDDPDMLEIVREFAAELPARIAKLEAHARAHGRCASCRRSPTSSRARAAATASRRSPSSRRRSRAALKQGARRAGREGPRARAVRHAARRSSVPEAS